VPALSARFAASEWFREASLNPAAPLCPFEAISRGWWRAIGRKALAVNDGIHSAMIILC